MFIRKPCFQMNAVSYQRNNVTTQVGCRHLVWTMLAHYHGQVWNAAEPARSLGVNESTVRRYLDLLDGVFMVRQLRPWHENLKKRQVKSPKIFLRDSGLLHRAPRHPHGQ